MGVRSRRRKQQPSKGMIWGKIPALLWSSRCAMEYKQCLWVWATSRQRCWSFIALQSLSQWLKASLGQCKLPGTSGSLGPCTKWCQSPKGSPQESQMEAVKHTIIHQCIADENGCTEPIIGIKGIWSEPHSICYTHLVILKNKATCNHMDKQMLLSISKEYSCIFTSYMLHSQSPTPVP